MGGDHHDHHHQQKVVVPDYKIYKIEDCPELVKVKDKLAAKGLSDPWLRNDVWRFHSSNWKGKGHNVRTFLTTGMFTGIAMFGLTLAFEAWAKPYDHPHHEHDDDHH